MCGILGSVNRRLDRGALDLIKHRGPDGAGIARVTVGPSDVTIAHRRLAIVDLSPAGRQPMRTADGNGLITYNGEIYNHLDLRKRLNEPDWPGHCDATTALRYIARRGIEAVADFNGIFAFCYVDVQKGKCYLARDPFGVKPLYYRLVGGTLLFASEIRAILQMAGDELDRDNLAELLHLRYLPAPDTLFKNIRKVRPGHYLEVDLLDASLPARQRAYVSPPGPPPGRREISYPDALDRYGELFSRAVDRQLMSDVEVGVLLSGGVDSALVAAAAQGRAGYRMKAFTVGFAGHEDADEIDDARRTAELLGMEHHFVRIGFDDFLGSVRQCTAIVEEPLATTSIAPMLHLSALAAGSVKVVLTGQGADEPLGGYLKYQQELFRPWVPPVAARSLRRLAGLVGVKGPTALRALGALGEKDDLARFIQAGCVFSQRRIEAMTGRRPSKAAKRLGYFYDLLRCGDQPTSVERMMSLDLRTSLADDLLLYTDKVTMHHSMECRVPMLDLELVRFVESLPGRYRLRLGRGKIIHKQFAARLLPRSIIRRRKNGFLSPTKAWFRNSGPLREILLDRGSRLGRFIDLREVDKTLTEHAAGFNRERHIFLLLSLHYWMADMLQGGGPASNPRRLPANGDVLDGVLAGRS